MASPFKTPPIKVCVTGAAGQIAYTLVPIIAKGAIFGDTQPIVLSLLDVPEVLEVLNGVCMELTDCAYPLLTEAIPTDDPREAFKDVDAVFLVGSAPRREGMERKDLMYANVRIFMAQGEVLDKVAKDTVKVLMVANPSNTNAMVCSQFAPNIPKENFSCLTRLDQNRAQSQIANHLGVAMHAVKNLIIWGNHSPTMFPDIRHATVFLRGKEMSVPEAIADENYIKHHFIPTVQMRGDTVIKARKMSSAMSAAKGAADHMRDWWFGTEEGRWVSMGVFSKGEYGIPEGLMYSFPVTIGKDRKVTVVQGLDINDFARSKMDLTAEELQAEKKVAEGYCAED